MSREEPRRKQAVICFCTSIYCRNCLNENTRKKLFQMYICHPILTTHVKMCETVATLINLPQEKVRRIFSRLQSYMLNDTGDASALLHNKALKGYDGNFPRKLSPLELCQIKRKLLCCKPVWFIKTFGTCCRIFRYKLDGIEMVNTLTESGKIKFRRISNRISKKSKLIAIEDVDLRLKRISYIQRIQKYRKEGRRIIYINAMMPIADKMIIIAASVDGPITSAFIKSTNADGFLNWLTKDILENLKEPCVFVLGPSCTFRSESCLPQPTHSKAAIISWLECENIPYDRDMYKTELYDLVVQHSDAQPSECGYIVNKYLTNLNHSVLHIPDNNRDLDPFEYIWFHIKLRMIANGTASFNINRQLCSLPKEMWKEQFHRIHAIETVYLQIERNFDRTYRRFRIDNDDFKTNEILHAVDIVHC